MEEQRVSIPVDGQITLRGGYTPASHEPRGQALILHPHPLYGGSMRNNVVEALRQGALEAGWGVLRFNFRGFGGSTGSHDEGRGEQRDVTAAAAWLAQAQPGRLALFGYSFGALVGSHAASALPGLAAGLWVAPALVLGEMGDWPPDAGPLLLISGDGDQYSPLAGVRAYAASQGARCQSRTLAGADHFLNGRESVLIQESQAWLQDLA